MTAPAGALVAAQAAYQAGFRGDALVDAVAIAGAESTWNPQAWNPNPPDDSYGEWQVNYYGNLRGPRTARYGPPQSMFDPANAARAAFDISGQGTNFSPWSTWTSGAWRAHLNEARDAVTALLGGAAVPASSGGGNTNVGLGEGLAGTPLGPLAGLIDQFNPVQAASNAVTGVGQDIVQGLFRLAVYGTLLAAGAALIVAGGWRSVSSSSAASSAKDAAMTAAVAA